MPLLPPSVKLEHGFEPTNEIPAPARHEPAHWPHSLSERNPAQSLERSEPRNLRKIKVPWGLT